MSNVKRLPDAYYKGTGGNNYRLLNLNESAVGDLRNDAIAVHEAADIMKATGKTLDLYGNMLNQSRGDLTDEQYRFVILNKIGKNLCTGDYNSVVNLLAQMLNGTPDQIILNDSDNESCKVNIEKIPFSMILNAGFTAMQVISLVEMLLPVCIKVSSANFDGTFEFSDLTSYSDLSKFTYAELSEHTYGSLVGIIEDKEKGFGNIEQTIGGHFGLIVHGENNVVIPI